MKIYCFKRYIRKKRIDGQQSDIFSIVKGVGIILMVIGHANSPFHDFIYLFHMPLFFMISGFFFNPNKIYTKKAFFFKRLNRLYIPFVFWNILFLFLHNILYKYGIYSTQYIGSEEYILHIAKIFLFTDAEPILAPLWFLKSLFIGNISVLFVFFVTSRLKLEENIQRMLRLVIFIFALLVGFIIKKFEGHFFYDLHRELITMFLVYLGFMLAKCQKSFLLPNFMLLIVCFLVLCVCSQFFTFEFAAAIIVNPIIMIMISILGFYMIYTFSSYIQRIKILSSVLIYVGKHTMPILILHLFAFKMLSLILDGNWGLHTMDGHFIKYVGDYWWSWILFSLVGVAFPISCIWLYKQVKCLIRF